jgi:outer membrane receptor protein involved in Fe transport
MRRTSCVLLSISLFGIPGLRAAEPLPSGGEETVQVTATRIPEVAENLPTIVSVLDGEMLRERGMTDLRSALGVVAGVDIAPGGDGGPASAVPEMWGLREFDAFLLVVDGVPWGGAFNPDLPTLSLRDVARIEVMRGSAPVMYGATSFVGVIHVIHNTAGSGHGEGQVIFGDHSSVGIAAAVDVASGEELSSRIGVDWMQQGYPDDRTDWERAHVLWRNRMAAGGGHVRLDVDLHWLDQSPASPAPRVGPELSPLVPIDANVNPLGSHVDPRRQTVTLGYDHAAGYGSWEVTASYAHRSQDVLRGFLAADPDSASLLTAAHGFRQTTAQDEWYLDGHMNFTHNPKIVVVAGADLLYGDARAHGGDFDYEVNYDGTSPPDGTVIPNAADVSISDTRTFGGLYGYAVWTPQWRWRLDAGLRANFTHETRDTSELELSAPPAVIGSDSRSENRVAGSVGASFTVWKDKDDSDDVKMFAGYRNTFKPAAIEFEPDPEILEPEEGQSYEIGARAALLDHKLELELDVFQMDLKDIVVAEEGGNAGYRERGRAETTRRRARGARPPHRRPVGALRVELPPGEVRGLHAGLRSRSAAARREPARDVARAHGRARRDLGSEVRLHRARRSALHRRPLSQPAEYGAGGRLRLVVGGDRLALLPRLPGPDRRRESLRRPRSGFRERARGRAVLQATRAADLGLGQLDVLNQGNTRAASRPDRLSRSRR